MTFTMIAPTESVGAKGSIHSEYNSSNNGRVICLSIKTCS